MLSEIVAMVRPTRPWRLRLTGHSMTPTIREGDDLLVVPQSGDARLGDVVVFPHREILVAHRVIGTGATLLTAGDASRGAREEVAARDVLGTVVEVRRREHVIRTALRSPLTALLLRARLALQYHLRLRR